MKAGVSHPTKEQWAEIAKRLDNLFEKVYLRCDGFLVEAEMNRLGKNSLVIAVFVNGRMHAPGWVTAGENVTEEVRRFWRRRERFVFPSGMRKEWVRKFGKRDAQARGILRRSCWYEPFWIRPRPFIAHLKANNERIEIIDRCAYVSGLQEIALRG